MSNFMDKLSRFPTYPLYIQLAIIAWFILLVSSLFISLDMGKRMWYNTKAGRRAKRRFRETTIRKGKF